MLGLSRSSHGSADSRPRTGVTLFQDPSYIKSLEDLFYLSRMSAESPNPSGPAHALLTFGAGGPAVLSQALPVYACSLVSRLEVCMSVA